MNQLQQKFIGYSITSFAQNDWMHSFNNGITTLHTPLPVSEHTIFHAGSLSKVVTAVLTLKLISKGLLTLDEPIQTLPIQGVTVRHLLAHFSGITDQQPIQTFVAPGNAFLLADTNYRILQQLIEYKTAQHFEDVVQAEIFEPLAMTNSFYVRPHSSYTTYGYTKTHTAVEPITLCAAADGLWTSSYDFAKLLAALMQNLHYEAVLGIETSLVQQMFRPQFGYKWLGLGIFFEQHEATAVHVGDGYRALLSIDLSTLSGYVAFTNCEVPMIQLHELISKIA